MNYLIFAYGFVCLILTINGDGGLLDEHAAIRGKCFKELGLQEGELTSSGSATFHQNEKSKCYLECFVRNLGLFKEDDSLDAEKAAGLVNEEIREEASALISKCINGNAKIPNRCEKAFAVVACLHKEAPESLFLQLGILEPPQQV